MFTQAFLASKLFFLAHDLIVCRTSRQAALLGGQLQGLLAVEFGLADELLDAAGQTLRGICLCTRVAGRFRTDQERDFAAGGTFFEGSREFGESAAAELFVQFRNFARDTGAPIAQHLARVGNTLRDTVWSFVKDDSAVLDAQLFEGSPALAAARRQKADEEKFFVGQARSGKGSEQRGWSGDRNDGNVMP